MEFAREMHRIIDKKIMQVEDVVRLMKSAQYSLDSDLIYQDVGISYDYKALRTKDCIDARINDLRALLNDFESDLEEFARRPISLNDSIVGDSTEEVFGLFKEMESR